jgi:hypothetical protein
LPAPHYIAGNETARTFQRAGEAMMILAICGIFVVVLLVVSGMVSAEARGNAQHMINAKWLDDAAKFRLVARWGIKG